MCVRSLPLLLIAALGAQAESHFNPPRAEGEVCGRIRGQVWTCQRESACTFSAFQASRSRRITCNTDQEERVSCCPNPRSTINGESDTISERKCREYKARVTCPSRSEGQLDGIKPKPIWKLRRRQAQVLETMDEENVILNNTVTEETMLERKILNGNIVRAKEHPHSALIGYSQGDSIVWGCGGTLISERYVLSAAHCYSYRRAGRARWVRLGDLDYASSSDDEYVQNFSIIKFIKHPKYSNDLYYNDIALLKLNRPAVFNEYVAPACLYTSTSNPDELATATGWGKTSIKYPNNTVLRVVDLDFVRCDDGLKWKVNGTLPNGVDHQTMICAWGDGKDTCTRDSGGPLILADWKGSCLPRLVGVTSFGPPCEPSRIAAVYNRVAAFRLWIESIVWPQA